MSATNTDTIANLRVADLEAMLRRIVREEIAQIQMRASHAAPAEADAVSYDVPDDDEDDDELVAMATEAIEQYKRNPERWLTLEDFEAELDRAEAAGELPN